MTDNRGGSRYAAAGPGPSQLTLPAAEVIPAAETPAPETPAVTLPAETAAVEITPVETAPVESVTVETVAVQEFPENLLQWVPETLDFWPSAALACVLGCALGLMLARLFGRKKRRGRLKLRSVAVQGLGARSDQQDALFMTDPKLAGKQGLLLCVADGMGGLANGGAASQAAVSAVADSFKTAGRGDPRRLLITLLQSANNAVNMRVAPHYGSAGTTLLLGYVRGREFWYASVGDSRICLCRDGELIHLTRPHTFEGELLLRHINGSLSYESVQENEKKAALTSFLGMGTLRAADCMDCHLTLRRGDRVILMSDGVFNTLSDSEIARILQKSPAKMTGRLAAAIEKKKNPYQDNFSAVILAVN